MPIGGHNPIEPASLATPVIMGAYDDNCKDLVEALKQVGALVQLPDEPNISRAILKLIAGIFISMDGQIRCCIGTTKTACFTRAVLFVLRMI